MLSINHKHIAFLIYSTLFFIFFIYTFAVLKGFPDFLGGMFSYAILAFFPIAFLTFLTNLKKEPSLLEWLFFILVLYVFLYSVFVAAFLNTSSSDPPVLKGLAFIGYSLIGWYLGRFTSLDNKLFNLLNKIYVASICIFYLVTMLLEQNIFAILFILVEDKSGIAATYQGIGRSIFFIALITLLFSSGYKSTIFSIFFILLFLTSSRTHIIAFMILSLLYLFLISPMKSSIVLTLILFLGLGLATLLNIYYPEIYDSIVTSRISEIFDLASSSSFALRLETIEIGWNFIKNYPIFGSFGHYFYYNTGYPHNILYAWSNWGIIPFFLIITILIFASFRSLSIALKSKSHQQAIIASYSFAIFFIYLFLSAPIEDLSLGILLGLYRGIYEK